jgi:hypothetical protein
MNVVKFRAWNLEYGMGIVVNILFRPTFTSQVFYNNCKTITSRIEDLVLMQYTGLVDIKNKEIYEGDILRVAEKYLLICSWDESRAQFQFRVVDRNHFFGIHKDTINLWKVEIIGNIYENKNILV